MLQMKLNSTYNRKGESYRFLALFLSLILCVSLIPAQTVYAAGLSIYNYTTKKTSTYTGTKVSYTVNGALVETNGTPGMIMSNGAALGSYYDIFKIALGVNCKYDSTNGTITFKTADTTLVLTLGSKTAVKNGKKETMSNAPTKYKFNDSGKVKVYVPTRYVAEALGFEYTWNSSTATSSIKKSISLTENGVVSTYNGNFLSVSVDSKVVSYNGISGIIHDGSALVSIKKTFADSAIQANYVYTKKDKSVVLQKGDITINMTIGSNVAYVNDVKYIMETAATIIKYNEINSSYYVMVPLEFVAEKLGYQVDFDEKAQHYSLSTTEETGRRDETEEELEISSSTSTSINTNDSTVSEDLSVYFTWKAPEELIHDYKAYNDTCITQVKAVSAAHSDALIIYGITSENVQIVNDSDFILIKIKNVRNLIGSELYYDAANPYLNYCSIEQSEEETLISILKMRETIYYSYDSDGACIIHFTERFETEEDRLFDIKEENNTQTNESEESIVFPDDCFIIPLPEEITYDQLSDTDNYENLSFSIFISGNHAEFLQKQKTQNPYGVLKSYTAVYDSDKNQTKLTFTTKKIQGYSYKIEHAHLLVTITDPRNIYDKIVVLDAGHGGIDPGAMKNNVQEKQINFAVINQYAKEFFDNSDIKVYYTRTTDTKIDLYERAAFADKVGADLFISFHVNAHNSSSVNGTSVYYSTENNTVTSTGLSSSILAKKVLNNMLAEWGTKNKGVLTNNFVVVHYNTVPAILVECAFLTNTSDFKKITDTTYQKKAAKAIFEAVEEIFKTYPTKR